jgi:hypothetical protein
MHTSFAEIAARATGEVVEAVGFDLVIAEGGIMKEARWPISG